MKTTFKTIVIKSHQQATGEFAALPEISTIEIVRRVTIFGLIRPAF